MRERKREKDRLCYVKLTKRETLLLERYCKKKGLSKSMAIKQILKIYLQEEMSEDYKDEPENQLDLFQDTQMNIFDVIR